jgi:hypothetical protein
LRSTLSDLSKILPQPADSYVTIDTEKIAWNQSTEIWLDVDAFVEASADGALWFTASSASLGFIGRIDPTTHYVSLRSAVSAPYRMLFMSRICRRTRAHSG